MRQDAMVLSSALRYMAHEYALRAVYDSPFTCSPPDPWFSRQEEAIALVESMAKELPGGIRVVLGGASVAFRESMGSLVFRALPRHRRGALWGRWAKLEPDPEEARPSKG